ncbi:protein phosphatase [Streptomyces eurocidicus]|uniref:Serine/threonine protein phosphatase PrpC n=1 Tax=Streptomyces eurocidicus TaxID=66423 RepID=A0A7W8B8G5_STREU|nr:PP2C family serine/threonine-protein phosphatase [Streptomyces eurocidicus]MBB5117551.1 serine/threonine protein phosphatase PrpC [Streptomyces eurocidicus]MBF6053392.1 protein phosphatase [Streptomyces eurocidicus]
MSQLPRPPQLTACPVCHEPLEPGDNFCGGCGADLSAPPPGERFPAPSGTPAAAPRPPRGPAAPGPPPGADASVPDPRAFGGVPAQSAHGALAGRGDRPRPDGGRSPLPAANGTGRTCGACRSGMIDKDGYCEHCGHAPRERDHMEHQLPGVAAVSDRGLRHHRNEDAYAVSTVPLADGGPATVAVVSDGVSSATRPDEASAAACAAARETLVTALPRGTDPRQATHDAIVRAAEAVTSLAAPPPPANEPRQHETHRQENAPACTIVTAVVTGDLLTVGWIGDSRAYWVPEDRATQPARLTEDDSWAAQMVAAGLLSEAEAYADERAHAITGWLGADAYEVDPHTASFHPDRKGVVIVCTDGLWNYAESAERMAEITPPDARSHPLECARRLLAHALDGGGHDNVTVAVLPFPLPPEGAGSA